MIEPAEREQPQSASPVRSFTRVSLVTAGAVTLASRIGVIILSAVTGIITARFLGPAERGIYTIPNIEASFVIATFGGLGTATSYFMLNRGVGRGVLRPALLTAVLLVAVGCAAIVALAFGAKQTWSIAPAIAALVPYAILNVASGFYLGRGRVITNSLLMSSSTVATFVLMTVAMLAVGHTAKVAIGAWLLAYVVAALAAVVMLWRDAASMSGSHLDFRSYASYAIRIGFISLTSLLNYRVDVYLVAMFSTPAELALYTLAVMAAETVGTFTQVLPQITLPEIGRLNVAESAEYTARCARTNVALAGVVCAGLFFVAPFLVTLLYGEAFAGAVRPLRVLLIGAFARAPASLLTTYFMIKLGRPRPVLTISLSSAALSAILGIVLIPRIGIMGGAVATAASYVFGEVIAVAYFSRLSGMSIATTLIFRREDLVPFEALLRRLRSKCAF